MKPIIRCANTETGEVLECRCSRNKIKKLAYLSKEAGKPFKFTNLKIWQVADYAYKSGGSI